MIATGDYFRGPELEGSQIFFKLGLIMNALIDIRGNWKEGDSPGAVVVFVVPGSLGDVNFNGQRVTLFSRKKKLVQIEAAIPKELVHAENIDSFLIEALRQAARTAAEAFAKKKAGEFNLAKADAIIDQVQALLADTHRQDHGSSN